MSEGLGKEDERKKKKQIHKRHGAILYLWYDACRNFESICDSLNARVKDRIHAKSMGNLKSVRSIRAKKVAVWGGLGNRWPM